MWANIIELIETTSRVSLEALLNGLWQGLALTLVIWALVRFTPRLHPRGRFAIWAATLAVVVGLPFVSGQRLLPPVVAQYFFAGGEHYSHVASAPRSSSDMTLFASANDANSAESVSEKSESAKKTRHARAFDNSPAKRATLNHEQGLESLAENRPQAKTQAALSTGSSNSKPTAPFRRPTDITDVSTGEALVSLVLSRNSALILFGLWLFISTVLLLRLGYSYWRLQNLQTAAGAVPAPKELCRRLAFWKERQEISREVSLLISQEVTVPLAVGFGAPAVILPAEMAPNLTDDELDLVFVHELAHLKRRDDWSVLWQQVAQALFFVNPATIWIARRLDIEREMACDSEVVSYLGSPRKYAACLTRLAELSSPPRHGALAAGTFVRKSRLVSRIERLLSNSAFGNSRVSRISVVATFSVLALALAQFTLTPALFAIEKPHVVTSENVTASVVTASSVIASNTSPNNVATIRSSKIDSYSANVTRSSAPDAQHDVSYYESLRKRAQEKIQALESKLRKVDNGAEALTPALQVKLQAYQKSLEGFQREYERLTHTLDRHVSRRSERRSVGYVPLPSLKQRSPGYAYAYVAPTAPAVPAPPAYVPSVDIAVTNPVVVAPDPPSAPMSVASGVVVSSGRNGGIAVSLPSFSVDGDGNWSLHDEDGELTYQWSEGRHKIRVRTRGAINFSADESDIVSISDEGYFDVRERDRGLDREYEVLADEDGELDKTFYKDGRRSEIDEDAKRWIQETILFVFRNSSIGAKERAKRILERDGVDGVLNEIGEIDTDNVKGVYYSALLSSGELNGKQTRDIIASIAHDLDSDYEKAQALSNIDAEALQDDKTLTAYVDAVGTIGSDYEKRRSLATALSRTNLPKDVTLGLLRSAESFDSDYERAELLKSLAEGGLADSDVVDAYAEAIAGIESDYEKRRALEAITDRRDLSEKTILSILKMAQDIGSDYERAELLSEMSRYTRDDDAYAKAYYDAIVDIDSNYEKRRVLSKLLKGKNISEELAVKILELAQTIDSDYERAELLTDLSQFNEGNPEFYRHYVKALKDIDSDYETHRALKELDLDSSTPKEILLDVLSIIDGFSSDYEKAGALKQYARLYTGDDTLYDAYIDVVEGIDSSYERDRVYAALYKADRSAETKSRRHRSSQSSRSKDGRD